ncbi:pentapeptide repeat-containing protein [Streptomyces zagrosensis]|uniref:pentapeptide repeat-containing protein n=1 Tax=Streptomyces zagrosensis TaxID=1042984 RepID=UPI001614C44A
MTDAPLTGTVFTGTVFTGTVLTGTALTDATLPALPTPRSGPSTRPYGVRHPHGQLCRQPRRRPHEQLYEKLLRAPLLPHAYSPVH